MWQAFPGTSLSQRYHHDLADCQVIAWNGRALLREAGRRLFLSRWRGYRSSNCWFMNYSVRMLRKHAASQPGRRPTLFAYSYAAREQLRYAKAAGWKTILGQIDGGPAEERIVQALEVGAGTSRDYSSPAPADYWASWREELQLADVVMVNSKWSKTLIEREPVAAGKIAVVPLAYARPTGSLSFRREYPGNFDAARPLQLLFLGQLVPRKGIMLVFDAIRKLCSEPVHFTLVGPREVEIPSDLREHPQIRWVGRVSRSETTRFFQEADVFLFPTFSDGFGLTQLEAQAWRLPVIASRCCGEVITHQANGLQLGEVTAEALCQAIMFCCHNPGALQRFSDNAVDLEQFSLRMLGKRLLDL